MALSACGGGGGGSDPAPVNLQPTISGVPVASVAEGEDYSFQPTVNDPEGGALTCSIEGLPDWASFDPATCSISGTPGLDDGGEFTGIVITVSDGEHSVSLPAFSVIVEVNLQPTISGAPALSIVEGQDYSFQATVNDPEGDTLTCSIEGLPDWTTFDPATCTISGVPAVDDGGEYSDIVITVSDGEHSVSLPAFSVTVEESVSLSGKVIDGYVAGAVVFLDKNLNGQLDEGEPSAVTDNTGSYNLVLTGADVLAATQVPVRALLGEGATDIDTGEDFSSNPVLLSGLPLSSIDLGTAQNEGGVVTPFTTLVNDEVQDSLELVLAGSVTNEQLQQELLAAKASVSSELSQNADDTVLFGDFLNDELPEELKEELADAAIEATDDLQEAKARADELAEQLEDNQTVKTGKRRFSFVDWHTSELLYLVEEYSEIITKGDPRVVEGTAVKYFADAQYNLIMIDGEPGVYETAQWRETFSADGSFVGLSSWQVDKDRDGEKNFKGQSYRVGTYDDAAQSRDYMEYFDESSPSVEGARDNGRVFDDIDLIAAITEQDFSAVDMVQHKVESKQFGEGSLVSAVKFDEFAPTDLTKATYSESRTRTTTQDGVVTHLIEKDWDADGSINQLITETVSPDGTRTETNAKPVFARSGDRELEEYADFRWDGGELVSYWDERAETSRIVDGERVVEMTGARYVLDAESPVAALDLDGNKIKFQDWSTVFRKLGEGRTTDFTTYHHYALESYGFTKASDDIGQVMRVWEKGQNGLWVGYEFPEWGSQDIEDLEGQVFAALDAGVELSAFSDETIQGLSEYNVIRFSESFFVDEAGEARTWHIVNKFEGEWQVYETSLYELPNGWKLRLVPGGVRVLKGMYSSSIPLDAVDTEAGSFASRMDWNEYSPFYGFLDAEAAEEKLAQVIAEEEASRPRREVSIYFQLPNEMTSGLSEAELFQLYAEYELYAWNDESCDAVTQAVEDSTSMDSGIVRTSIGDFGALYTVKAYIDSTDCFKFLIHKDYENAVAGDLTFDMTQGYDGYVAYGVNELSYEEPELIYLPDQPEAPAAPDLTVPVDCSANPTGEIGPIGEDMWIRGSYVTGDNFAATPDTHKFDYVGNNRYQVKVTEPEATQFTFKFASQDWTNEYAADGSVTVDQTTYLVVASGVGTESIIDIPAAGDYVYLFEVNDNLDGGNLLVTECN
ncbi:hypothetical protein GCM10025776_37590 [Corallincola platygyrae]